MKYRNTRKRPAARMLMTAVLLLLLSGCGSVGRGVASTAVSADVKESLEADTTADSEIMKSEAVKAQSEAETGDLSESVKESMTEDNKKRIYITVGEHVLVASLEENSSAEALLEKLAEQNITVDMRDYANFEKVGPLGFELPRNDENYTTSPGDIILYQGNQIVFYYGTNTWNFTKLGEFQDVTAEDLKEIFGDGSITAEVSIEQQE